MSNSFEGLRAVKNKKRKAEPLDNEFGFLTVRLSKQDAKSFKRAAEDNGHTNQSGLIEAINRVMIEWNQPPVTDHGSAGKKK
jgi:hypothetical protein